MTSSVASPHAISSRFFALPGSTAPKMKTRRPATPARTSSLPSLVSDARLIGQPQAARPRRSPGRVALCRASSASQCLSGPRPFCGLPGLRHPTRRNLSPSDAFALAIKSAFLRSHSVRSLVSDQMMCTGRAVPLASRPRRRASSERCRDALISAPPTHASHAAASGALRASRLDCVWFGSSLLRRLQAREARLDIRGLDRPRVVIDQPRQIAGFRRRQFADRHPGNNCRMGRDSILNLVEGRQPEPHRTIPPGRIDAIHTEPQSRAVALLCEFNGLAGDGLGFTFHQGLGGHGNAVTRAFRLAARISRLSFLKGHYLSNTFANYRSYLTQNGQKSKWKTLITRVFPKFSALMLGPCRSFVVPQ